jgi:hypothetical protein
MGDTPTPVRGAPLHPEGTHRQWYKLPALGKQNLRSEEVSNYG